MHAGGVMKSAWLRAALPGAAMTLGLLFIVQLQAAAQERGAAPRRADAGAGAQDEGQDQYEDIVINVPNIVQAGRILRQVSLLKSQEGFPEGDGEPRFDAESSKLYFRTTAQNAAALKKILAQVESGATATPNKSAAPRLAAKGAGKIYSIEIWLVQLQLPKGEEVQLAGPREEMLTVLGGLEKESKGEVLNHIYLTAEDQRMAQAMLNESVAIVNSLQSGPSARESEAGKAPSRGVSAAVSREMIGTQVKVTPMSAEGASILLDYSVMKSYLSKTDEGSFIPTDTAGGGYKQPNTRLFEVESAARVKLGSVVAVSSQSRGGEKPTEIRVLMLVNPL